MKSYNILFLCTHNSARSIIGEALASTHPSGKFKGFSAGSTPGTSVNPIAADIATELGMDHTLLKSKSWDVYGQPDAPKMDFIITVCDNAAGEQCPFWPGQPATARWISSLLFVTMRLVSNAHFGLDSLLLRTGDFLIHHKFRVQN